MHTRNIINPSAGVKVSGKMGTKSMLAALYARDEPSAWAEAGEEADFTVLRFKWGLSGDSYIGGFYTGTERADGYNRVFGLDGLVRTGQASTIGYHGFVARSLEDSSGGPTEGHAVGIDYRFNNRNWDAGLTGLDISEGFQTDIGYMNRTGVSRLRAHGGPKLYRSGGPIQRVDLTALTEHTYDKPGAIWESFNFVQARLVLPRNSSLFFRYNLSSEVYVGEELETTGFSLRGASQITKELFLHVFYRQGAALFYSEDPYQGDSRELTATLRYQPSEQIDARVDYTTSSFKRRADNETIYDYAITRGRLTYQLNKYLFFRGIVEYNAFHRELLTDLLASFTYIPGTVLHFGYGSLYEKTASHDGFADPLERFRETRRGLFFKASYLWRM